MFRIASPAVLLALLAPLFVSLTAMAQEAPPQPSLQNTAAPWIGYLFIAVLLMLVLAVSLMPSKRGHQD